MMTDNDNKQNSEQVVPVVDEELTASRRVVKIGSVQVHKYVDKTTENVTVPLVREMVEIRRVPVNRPVESVPEVKTFGDTTVIPVVEEELVITKRLVLKEEVHMTRKRTRQNETREVVLGKERAEVIKLDRDGRIESPHHETERRSEFPIGNHRPVLGKS